jgi:hypothetical protein
LSNGVVKAIESEVVLCANCKAPLLGPFCHQCGQAKRTPVRELLALVKDSMGELFSLDGRFFKSLLPLYFKPGTLTLEYLKGKRSSFILPFRMYLGISIVMLILLSWSGDSFQFESRQNRATPSEQRATDEQVKVGLVGPKETGVSVSESGFNMNFNGEPYDPVNNPVRLNFAPAWFEAWFNQQLGEFAKHGHELSRSPERFAPSVLRHLPHALFFLLPVFAFLLKLLYLFKRRLYVEHVIVALHSHSFLFLNVIFSLFLSYVMELWQWNRTLQMWVLIVMWSWAPIYLFVMQKRVYGQGWIMTTIKYGVVGLSYTILVAVTMLLTLLLAIRFLN